MSKLKEKGITLIALIVTVIILLILAGVTISQISGNNGLFSKVKQAVDKYKNASLDEELAIGEIERYLEGFNITEKEEGVLIDITRVKVTALQRTIKVEIEVTGEVSRVVYRLNKEEEWKQNEEDEKSLTYTFEELSIGSYNVKVRAYDKNGKYVEAESEIITIGETTTAQEKDVLEGKTYISGDGSIKIGNMINYGTVEEEIEAGKSYEIKEGYYAGGTITSKGGSGLTGPTGKTLVTSVRTTDHGTIEAEDLLGNPVTVPGQFKVVRGVFVEHGIVIEDADGNQFVWIPVSNIDGNNDGTGKGLIKKEDGTTVEITLGRYEFSTSDGKEKLRQKGANHGESSATTLITLNGFNCYENTKDGRPNGGVGAKALDKFVESVEKNHGYYIGRYEASFGSGNSIDNYKPHVKVSTGNSTSSMTKSSGILWHFITQGDASKVCQNMYNAEDRDIESDLVNSYAWDTAIVYIQTMGNKNYANATCATNGNGGTLKNTGETGDEKCHIFDMAGNLYEWTTEYSTEIRNGNKLPCVDRGGNYGNSSDYTATRRNYTTTSSDGIFGFRPLIYIK